MAKMECGDPGIVDKIQNGRITQRGEFPWMVLLEHVANPYVYCAGTLIHPRYVLTAALCFKKISIDNIRARVGVYDLLKYRKGCRTSDATCVARTHQHKIVQKIEHPTHNIGLLKLVQPVELVLGAVQLMCLPIYEHLRVHMPIALIITGWGMSSDARHPSSIMLKGNTQVVQTRGCDLSHTFCSGGLNQSHNCPGDMGGPYQAQDIYNGNVRYVQYGLILDDENDCSAYSSQTSRGILVGYFLDWILDNMAI